MSFNTQAAILLGAGDESLFKYLFREFLFFSSTVLRNIDFALELCPFSKSSEFSFICISLPRDFRCYRTDNCYLIFFHANKYELVIFCDLEVTLNFKFICIIAVICPERKRTGLVLLLSENTMLNSLSMEKFVNSSKFSKNESVDIISGE